MIILSYILCIFGFHRWEDFGRRPTANDLTGANPRRRMQVCSVCGQTRAV